MGKESFDRRKFCAFAGASSVLIFASSTKHSHAVEPLFLGPLIAAIATGVFNGINALIERNKNAQIALEQEKRRVAQQKIDYLFDFLPSSDKLLLLQNGSYMNAVLSGDLDGFGSTLAVRDGQLSVARGDYYNKVHSDMAKPMAVVMNEAGRLPIPTLHLRAAENDRMVHAGAEYISDKMGTNKDMYLASRVPKIITPMSLAKSPTKGGEDFAFFTTLNVAKQYNVGGKSYAPVEVNPVPMQIMRA